MGIPPSITAQHSAYASLRPAAADAGGAKSASGVSELDSFDAGSSFALMQAGLAHTSSTELPKALAARLSVESVDGIALDHIPFVGDAAVLIDDLPAPAPVVQKPADQAPASEAQAPLPVKAEQEIKDPISPDSKLAQAAAQGYLAGREVVGQIAQQTQAPPQPSRQASVSPPAKL